MPIARNHQSFAEVLVSGPVKATTYHQVVEVLESGPTPASNYHQFAEVLFEKTNTAANVYHQFAEVLIQKDQATCFNYQQFVELLIQYDPTFSISDRAFASDGFDAYESGVIELTDADPEPVEATFIVGGSFSSAPEPDRIEITDSAIASDGFITETPTLIALGDIAIATDAFSMKGRITITDNAIASQKLQTILNGNPGILTTRRYPW